MSDAPTGTIVVVDDDGLVLAVLKKLLGQAGHRVETSESAAAALEKLDEADLIVTDMVMPGMDGAALLAEVQRRRPGLPVIVMTAHATIEGAVELMRLGAFDYLVKPVTAEAL